jgi:thiamine transport system substrate-binding protein
MNYKAFVTYVLFFIITLVILFLPYIIADQRDLDDPNALRIMTHSSFMSRFGAGPEIAKRFTEKTGIPIRWINAGNAGLLIERLKFKRDTDQPDIVIGFDQFSIFEARRQFQWLDIQSDLEIKADLLPAGARFHDFLAYDWGPLTFIYREGELPEPRSFNDLLDPIYKGKIILQDPRISSPGLQFLLWVLAEKGEAEGIKYLDQLKSSLKIIAPSWSASYNLFQVERPSLVFSYFTSIYSHKDEVDNNYRAAVFPTPHPIQVEYAAIPDFCTRCEQAKEFARFLLDVEIQSVLMEKNYMFPVISEALKDSDVQLPEGVIYRPPIDNVSLIKKKRELVNRWKKVFF